ncbi:MAG: hypothetical protein FJ303_14055 [Planctomycetes bacterium]|nr:hypothetical protein [Planctomycetota bacterium]
MSDVNPNEHVAAGEPAHSHTPAADHGAAVSTFSDADWEQFQAEDFSAGQAVVILMLGIFLTGVFIYSVVAYWVVAFSN